MQEVTTAINDTETQLLKIIALFKQEDFNTVPFEGSWTAAQVCEHLIKGVDPGILYTGVQEAKRKPDEKVGTVKKIFLDFTIKMKSPDFIVPSNTAQEIEVVSAILEKSWKAIREAAENMDLSATCTDFSIPGFGDFTRLEWIWFYIFHTRRHIHQLKNILQSLKTKNDNY